MPLCASPSGALSGVLPLTATLKVLGAPTPPPRDQLSPPGRSFLARFGPTLTVGGIAALAAALFRYQGVLGLSPQLVWFIASKNILATLGKPICVEAGVSQGES